MFEPNVRDTGQNGKIYRIASVYVFQRDSIAVILLNSADFQLVKIAVFNIPKSNASFIFLGSDDGRILKFVVWKNGTYIFLEETRFAKELIVRMEVKKKYLLNESTMIVITQMTVYRISLD